MTKIVFNKKHDCKIQVKFVNKKDIKKISDNSMKTVGFSGEKNTFYLTNNTVFAGIDGIKDSDDWRILGFKLIKYLKKLKAKSVKIDVPNKSEEFIEGLQLGNYEFTKYKNKTKKSKSKLKEINIGCSKKIENKLMKSKFTMWRKRFS